MARRRVAKGREARNRRYVAAVRRQMDYIDGGTGKPHPRGIPGGYPYADVDEVLRTGDDLHKVLRGEIA